jgi:hypothetical protein
MVAAILAGALLLALLIGGLVQMGPALGPYRRSVDASFAQQADDLVAQNNATGLQLDRLLQDMPSAKRDALQSELGAMAGDAATQATQATALTPPSPAGGAGDDLVRALTLRAQGLSQLQVALDGLLGLSPYAPTGALTSSAQATAEVVAAGAALQAGDRAYATGRRALRVAPGHARLPRSVWVTHPGDWSAAGAGTLVDELARSSSLTPSHHLQMVTVGLSPQPVPPPTPGGPAGGATTVPPTRSLTVSVVLANRGNVTEHHVVVWASTGPGPVAREAITVDPGNTAAVTLPPLPVSPGHTYALTVALRVPPGESPPPPTTYQVAVAPSTA